MLHPFHHHFTSVPVHTQIVQLKAQLIQVLEIIDAISEIIKLLYNFVSHYLSYIGLHRNMMASQSSR